MTVKIGTTRLVILVSDRAIKIATIRPLRLFFRLITLPFSSRRNRDRFSEKYGNCLLQALWKYFSAGLHANRAEYKYHSDNPDDIRVMPTIECRLYGLIIIQPRNVCNRKRFARRKSLHWPIISVCRNESAMAILSAPRSSHSARRLWTR
jgi:hypothetical protein